MTGYFGWKILISQIWCTLKAPFFRAPKLLTTTVLHLQSHAGVERSSNRVEEGAEWLLSKNTDECLGVRTSHIITSKKMAVNKCEKILGQWVARGVNDCRGQRSSNNSRSVSGHNRTHSHNLLPRLYCLHWNKFLCCVAKKEPDKQSLHTHANLWRYKYLYTRSRKKAESINKQNAHSHRKQYLFIWSRGNLHRMLFTFNLNGMN